MRRLALSTVIVVALVAGISPAFLATPARANPDIIYVDKDASGSNDGSSWADAYTTLQDALDGASSGDEIWVAEGTYKPTAQHGGSGERYRSFQMKNGVAIYGGFDGTETQRDQRNWQANPTILSGDIGAEGDGSDNCYHVFYHPSATALDETAILDGFTITAGNATGTGSHSNGSGMYNDSCSPTLNNCSFLSNAAGNAGGGMYNMGNSAPSVTSCSFAGNSATTTAAGCSTTSPPLR